MVYKPREDSFLLKKHIKNYAKGNVLDMGTGSGIQAEEASKYTDRVIAIDINPESIEYCSKNIKNNKILFVESDLFQIIDIGKISRKFNLIMFNPPYLPNDKYPDMALDGGKEGHELVERFLKDAKKHLEKDGKILLLISSLTTKKKVEQIMTSERYKFKLIDKENHSFETLYVYEVGM